MEAKKKWYQSGIAIGVLIFLFFPIGLFLMWKYSNWNKIIKLVLTGFYGLVVVGIFSPTSPTKTTTNSVQQEVNVVQTTQPSQTPIPTPSEAISDKQQATLIKVVDGDTVTVSIDGKSETIRVIGINSPETVDPRKSVECFGQKASSMAKEQLTGNKIQLESDATQGERDKYGRLLRYIWVDDGINDFGALMIQNGYAYEYTYNTPYKYQAKYKQLQKDAEVGKKGLWADDACPATVPTTKTTQPTSTQVPNNNNSGTSGTTSTSGGDKDCKDFSSQSQAQAYFNSKGGSASNNVDRLDGSDHDGIVCESLP